MKKLNNYIKVIEERIQRYTKLIPNTKNQYHCILYDQLTIYNKILAELKDLK